MAGDDIYEKLKQDLAELNKRIAEIPNINGQHFTDKESYIGDPFTNSQGTDIADGTFRLFDITLPDNIMMDGIEQEIIAITSPPSKLFLLDHERSVIDKVTGEAQLRYYKNPISVIGNYEAPSPIQELSRFGVTEAEEITMIFNLNYIQNILGSPIREGDVIQTYDGKLWEVISSIINSEVIWIKKHNELKLKRIRGEGYILPGIGDVSDSPLLGTPDGVTPKGSGKDGIGGSEEEPL